MAKSISSGSTSDRAASHHSAFYPDDDVRNVLDAEDFGEELYSLKSIGRAYTRQEDEEEQELESRHSQQLQEQNNKDSRDTTDASDNTITKEGDDNNNNTQALKKQESSHSQHGPPPKVNLFDPSVKHLWLKLCLSYLKIWFLLGCLIICAFSIYWGALYDRTGNLHRLEMLVVIEEDSISNGIGYQVQNLLETETYKKLGTWTILNNTNSINEFFKNPTNLTESIIEKVHHRKYWSATHIYPNATYDQLLTYRGDQDAQTIGMFVYETGRDITSVTPYVVSTLKELQASLNSIYSKSIAPTLFSQLSSDEKSTLLESSTLTTLPIFEYLDYRPYSNNTLLAPLQVGLIYLIIMSFFLFNFFVEPHKLLLPHVKIPQYLIYRIIGNHLSFIIVSLFISAVSAIFHVDFTKAFGRGGFVVYWFSTYLTMAAVGGANENMALIIFVHSPPFLGFWLISFVILNVSPSFSPLTLISPFYRYGYMMPIHHSNEISKVILLGLWKGELGMNYGVLAAWVVINTLLLPFCLKHAGGVMAKRAKAAALAASNANKN